MALARGTIQVVVRHDKYCANADEMADNGQVCQAHDQGTWFPLHFNNCPFCGKSLAILPPNQPLSDLLTELPSFGAGAIFKRKVAAATAGLSREMLWLRWAFVLVLTALIIVVVGLVHLVLNQPTNTGYSTSVATRGVSLTQEQVNAMVKQAFDPMMEDYLPGLQQIKTFMKGNDDESQDEQPSHVARDARLTNGDRIKQVVGEQHPRLPRGTRPLKLQFGRMGHGSQHGSHPPKRDRPSSPAAKSSSDDDGLY